MAHGTQDYANVRPKITTYTLSDMAELAERLGAVQSIDRLGDVVFIDNFEDGLCKWYTAIDSLDSTVGITGDVAEHGGFSFKVHLVNDDVAFVQLIKYLTYPIPSLVGLEFNTTLNQDMSSYTVYMDFFTGVLLIRFILEIDRSSGTISVLDSHGDWQVVVSDYNALCVNYVFHRFKLVIDLPNLTYIKLVTTKGVVDLRSIGVKTYSDTSLAHLRIMFLMGGSVSAAIDIYLDSVIVTQNEP